MRPTILAVPFISLLLLGCVSSADITPTVTAPPGATSTPRPRPSPAPSAEAPTPPSLLAPHSGGTPDADATPAGRRFAADCLGARPGFTPTPTDDDEKSTATPAPRREETEEPDATPSAPLGARLIAPRFDERPETLQLPPLREEESLMRAMVDALGDDADSYAFYVKDLTTGHGATHNAGEVFYAASMFKLFVMVEAFWQQRLGLIGWDDALVITPYYDSFGLTPRLTAACQLLTFREALEATMAYSDNAAAVLLQDLLGAPNINLTLEALGIQTSRLLTEGLPLTAEDVGVLFEAMGRGELISSEASQAMIDLLTHDIFDNGVREGFPPDTPYARKTGNYENAVHEGGLVFAPKGPYLFVVLSVGGSRAVRTELSRIAWEYFEGT